MKTIGSKEAIRMIPLRDNEAKRISDGPECCTRESERSPMTLKLLI